VTSPPLPHIDIVLIVAVAENGVIGINNSIPWRLKADMQRGVDAL